MFKVVSSFCKSVLEFCLTLGIKPEDGVSKIRAIRIANTISFIAIFNTFVFGLLFFFVEDWFLVRTCIYVVALYSISPLLSFFGYSVLGRASILLNGTFVILWFACYFEGQALIQLLFFSLCVLPFMTFTWEERKAYALSLLSGGVFIVGEYYSYKIFEHHDPHYELKYIRIFATIGTLHLIMTEFYYFLKQSIKFENQNNEYIKQIEIEHRKQLQVQKMSSLGEMASGIAHEINNPLTIISGKSHQAKRIVSKLSVIDPLLTECLDKIDSTVDRISKIIIALRKFSRNANNDSLESAKVMSIVDDTLDLCEQRFITAGIAIQKNGDQELTVFCRPTEISQVLLNLLNNAYDAVVGKSDAKIEIGVRAIANNYVEILVTDNGSGIPPEVTEKIMLPFFTTKEVGKGTGLGLSISKGIVESHGGKFEFLPKPGLTVFQILLPTKTTQTKTSPNS